MFNDDVFGEEDDNSLNEKELLDSYWALKSGKTLNMLDEDEFEYLINYFLQNEQMQEAIDASEIAITYYPYSANVLLNKAEVLFQSGKYKDAHDCLNQVDRLSITLVNAVLLRADILSTTHRYLDAVEFLKERLPLFEGEDRIDLLLELADVYDEAEKYDDVFDTLKIILKEAPDNAEALNKISFWADFCKRPEESIAIHKEILDADPFNAYAWFNLGAAYQGIKKQEEAVEAYEFCLALDGGFEAAYRNLADAFIRLNRYPEAIEALKNHLEAVKPEDVIYEALGHCYEKQKDFGAARKYYQEATRLNPADDFIFYRIGETYRKEENWDSAVKSYLTALKINVENAACLLAIGECYLKLDRPLDALSYFLEGIHLKPNNKRNWMALIKGLYYASYFQEMLDYINMARDIIGYKSEFLFFEALALFSMGRTKEALLHLEDGLTEAPQKVKIILKMQPELLQRSSVANLLYQYKRQK